MAEEKNVLFETAPIPKAFTALCLPVVIGMVINLLYNIADTWFVGRMGDPDRMAAVSLCAPIFIILMGLGNIFGIGGSSVISRLMGEKRTDRVHRASSLCFWGSVLTGVIAAAGLLLCTGAVLPMLGVSENTIGYTRSYFVVITASAPLILMSFMLMNVLRCDGAAKEAMFGSVLGSVVNLILDPVLIFVCDMGVMGAALATAIGYVASDAMYLYYVLKKSSMLSVDLREAKPDAEIILGVLAIGLPASITNVLSSVSNICLNNALLPYGDSAIAAMGIALKINNIVTLTQVGFAAGLPPIIGYNFGAGNKERLRAVLKAALGFIVIVGTALSVIMFLTAGVMVRAFMNTPEIAVPGTKMLRALMLCGPFLGVQFVLTNYFQATGKALPAMLLSLCRQGLVFLAVMFAMQALFGLNGVIYAQPAADYITLAIVAVLFGATCLKDLR